MRETIGIFCINICSQNVISQWQVLRETAVEVEDPSTWRMSVGPVSVCVLAVHRPACKLS